MLHHGVRIEADSDALSWSSRSEVRISLHLCCMMVSEPRPISTCTPADAPDARLLGTLQDAPSLTSGGALTLGLWAQPSAKDRIACAAPRAGRGERLERGFAFTGPHPHSLPRARAGPTSAPRAPHQRSRLPVSAPTSPPQSHARARPYAAPPAPTRRGGENAGSNALGAARTQSCRTRSFTGGG
jgi:hypothetical protein